MLQAIVRQQRRNPYPVYRLLRRIKPLLGIPRYRLWTATRYDDVKTILTEYDSFSSDFRKLMGDIPASRHGLESSIISADPPVHTKLRGLVSRAFTPRAVANLEPRIEQIAHAMLDQVVESGRIDLVHDLAYPLPVVVIAEMLGIPSDDHAAFKEWSDRVVVSADRVFTERHGADQVGDRAMYDDPMHEMTPYFRRIIAERRAAPRDDLISGLLAAEIDGERLSEEDVIAFATLLLIAGNVTTTSLISNAVLTLLDHPAAFAQLQSDRSLMPKAIEEVLRYRSPVQFMFRITTRDVALSGRTIPAGHVVVAFIGSANRDERQFRNANHFDITRSPNQHIAFGHGIHFCLGAPLARLEASVALNAILDRLPDLQRMNRRRLEPHDAVILNGVKHLPLRFTPVQAGR